MTIDIEVSVLFNERYRMSTVKTPVLPTCSVLLICIVVVSSIMVYNIIINGILFYNLIIPNNINATNEEKKEELPSNSIFSYFCNYQIILYNETLRELICNNTNRNISFKDIYGHNKYHYLIMKNYLEFIHLSKTGGESVESTLKIKKNHKRAMERINNIFNNNILSFTIIRNPYSRTFSWFKFCIHGWYDYFGRPHIPIAPFSKNMSCTDCRYALNLWTNKYLNDANITIKNAKIAFEKWLIRAFIDNKDCMETNLPYNIYLTHNVSNIFLVDLIMRFETLKLDWNIFLDILGVNKSIYKLKYKNIDKLENKTRKEIIRNNTRMIRNTKTRYNTKRKVNMINYRNWMLPSNKHIAKLLEMDWRYYYTEKSKDIVYQRFKLDFTLFNYDPHFVIYN